LEIPGSTLHQTTLNDQNEQVMYGLWACFATCNLEKMNLAKDINDSVVVEQTYHIDLGTAQYGEFAPYSNKWLKENSWPSPIVFKQPKEKYGAAKNIINSVIPLRNLTPIQRQRLISTFTERNHVFGLQIQSMIQQSKDYIDPFIEEHYTRSVTN